MNPYPHDHILLNDRNIFIDDIRSGAVVTNTEFELAAVVFLKQWFDGANVFVQKTSGSTGDPKEIVITREQMIASAHATANAIRLRRGYRSMICLDTRFIAGKMMCVRCLVTGMEMAFYEPVANPFISAPEDARFDFVALVPYQVEAILASPQRALLDRLEVVIIGGAPLNANAVAELKSFKSACFLTYGMTETMSHIALQRVSGLEANGAFECLPGVNIETDRRGCLVATVPWLAEKVITNDLVDIISSKNFLWVGRYDNIINTGGFKVNPEKIEFQIEKVFKSLNVNRAFFVAGIPDDKKGEAVTLFIEGPEVNHLLDDLQNRLKPVIQRFEMPRAIHFVDRFVYTSSNKLDRPSTLQGFRTRKPS